MSSAWDGFSDADIREEFRQGGYEASCVQYILRKMGRMDLQKQIKEHHKSEEGEARLGLAGLRAYSDFPMTLVTRKMRNISVQTLVTLLTRPTTIEPIQEYALAAEEYPDAYEAANLGLVFYWPGWTKFAVVHNSEKWLRERGMRIFWTNGRTNRTLYVETLDSLLQAMSITDLEPE
jgi:hypothetical protein